MKKILISGLIVIALFSCKTENANEVVVQKETTKSTQSNILEEVAKKDDPVMEIASSTEVQDLGDYYGAKAKGILAYQWGYALLRMETKMREYINVQNPKPNNTDNWLPAPDGPFYMILRLYQPNDEILNLKYKLPEVVKK